MKLTYEAILDDPKLLSQLLADARRERAQAVHRLLIAPIARLFAQPPLRRSRMLRRSAYC